MSHENMQKKNQSCTPQEILDQLRQDVYRLLPSKKLSSISIDMERFKKPSETEYRKEVITALLEVTDKIEESNKIDVGKRLVNTALLPNKRADIFFAANVTAYSNVVPDDPALAKTFPTRNEVLNVAQIINYTIDETNKWSMPSNNVMQTHDDQLRYAIALIQNYKRDHVHNNDTKKVDTHFNAAEAYFRGQLGDPKGNTLNQYWFAYGNQLHTNPKNDTSDFYPIRDLNEEKTIQYFKLNLSTVHNHNVTDNKETSFSNMEPSRKFKKDLLTLENKRKDASCTPQEILDQLRQDPYQLLAGKKFSNIKIDMKRFNEPAETLYRKEIITALLDLTDQVEELNKIDINKRLVNIALLPNEEANKAFAARASVHSNVVKDDPMLAKKAPSREETLNVLQILSIAIAETEKWSMPRNGNVMQTREDQLRYAIALIQNYKRDHVQGKDTKTVDTYFNAAEAYLRGRSDDKAGSKQNEFWFNYGHDHIKFVEQNPKEYSQLQLPGKFATVNIFVDQLNSSTKNSVTGPDHKETNSDDSESHKNSTPKP